MSQTSHKPKPSRKQKPEQTPFAFPYLKNKSTYISLSKKHKIILKTLLKQAKESWKEGAIKNISYIAPPDEKSKPIRLDFNLTYDVISMKNLLPAIFQLRKNLNPELTLNPTKKDAEATISWAKDNKLFKKIGELDNAHRKRSEEEKEALRGNWKTEKERELENSHKDYETIEAAFEKTTPKCVKIFNHVCDLKREGCNENKTLKELEKEAKRQILAERIAERKKKKEKTHKTTATNTKNMC